ncbi:MAG TPA: condensation domain-containing protein, partial [Longimicrobium sp.]|nr:condensation domain-containing protein [Longimicrobium sp.]
MREHAWTCADEDAAGSYAVEVPAGDAGDTYPLTPTQEAMLAHGRRLPGFYVQQFVCTLREPLDLARFRGAWERLAARHAALRTSFHLDAFPEPLQEVHPRVELPWTVHDWRGLPGEAAKEAMRDFLRDDRATPFRADHPPLARFAVLRMPGGV